MVLIIDDEVDLCLLLKSFFLSYNYKVHYCHSLAAGVELCKKLSPDILFLDNNLPDGNGWDKANWFFNKFNSIYIFLISAYQHNKVEKLKSNHFAILEKPLSLKIIQKTLNNITTE